MRTDPAAPRLLIYSQDGLGLGHLRRTTLLAGEFLAARPERQRAHDLRLTRSAQFFSAAAGHDYLKLPSIRKVEPGPLVTGLAVGAVPGRAGAPQGDHPQRRV